MSANDVQIGGAHYRSSIQHWDYVVANRLDYFQGQITKYVTRWREKGGLDDLRKARHFLDKYIEVIELQGDFYDIQSRSYLQNCTGDPQWSHGGHSTGLTDGGEG